VAILLFSLLAMAGCGSGLPADLTEPTLVFGSSTPSGSLPDTTDAVEPADPTKVTLTLWYELQEPEWPSYAAWSPNSQEIVVVGRNGEPWIMLYELTQRQSKWQINDWIWKMDFSPSGQLIVGTDYNFRYIDPATGAITTEALELAFGQVGIAHIAFLPGNDGYILGRSPLSPDVIGTSEIGVWDGDNKKVDILLQNDSFLYSLSVHPDGNMLLAGFRNVPIAGNADQVFLWSYPDMRILCQFPGDIGAFSDTGDLIATAHKEGSISIFDVQTCELIRSTPAEIFYEAFSISPNGHTLAFVDPQCCVIQFLDIETGKIVYSLPIPEEEIVLLDYSPSGEYLLSLSKARFGESSSSLQIWKVSPATPE
jgi:WD40 repeat protein